MLGMSPLQGGLQGGVAAVLKGEVDAVHHVSGKPINLFIKVSDLITKPEFAAMLVNAHFVPLDDSY